MRKLVAVLLIAVAPVAMSQRHVSLAISGGAVMPTGSFADAAGTGWNGTAALVLSHPAHPLSLKLDMAYSQFGFEGPSPVGDDPAIISGTLNAGYRFPSAGRALAPYLIAGAGAYNVGCGGGLCDSDTNFGWNAGLGTHFRLGALRPFLEGRLHSATGPGPNLYFAALTIGAGL
jgi:hypothetical protein